MKTTILTNVFFLLFVTLVSNVQAQTKKIAWRSHGGSNMTFTFELPDDFGIAEPSYYERMQQKKLADSTKAADSLAVCTPATSAKLPPVAPKTKQQLQAEKRQQKQEKQQQKKEIRQQYNQKIKALKKEKKEALQTQQVNTIQAEATPPAPQGVTQWLWLLLLPLAFVFGVSLQKP